MATRDPLAPGVYSMDVFRPFGSSSAPDGDIPFSTWLTSSTSAAVKVLERATSTNVIPGTAADGSNHDRVSVWYLFEVLGPPAPTPAPFPRTQLGSPTVQKLASAPGGITAADRTATPPSGTIDTTPPAGQGDWLMNPLNGLISLLQGLPPFLIVALLVALSASANKQSRARAA